MSYIVRKSNGQNLVTVFDETIDTTTCSIALVGRNTTDYARAIAENFINLAQNFSNTIAPNNPLQGQIWYDSKSEYLKFYNGSTWNSITGLTVNPADTNMTAGSVGVILTTTNGDIAVNMFIASGMIIGVVSDEQIPNANLPANVNINGKKYVVKSRFPSGIFAGITLANTQYSYEKGLKWGPSRTITFNGDVLGSVVIDGGANRTVSLNIANTGVIAGTYSRVTVGSDGRVISGQYEPPISITISGDITGTYTNGTIVSTLANSNVTAGSYGDETNIPIIAVDTKGRITAASSSAIPRASTTQFGLIRLTESLNSTSTTLAPTASAVAELANRRLLDGDGINVANPLWSTSDTATVSADFATGQEALVGTSTVKVMSPATTKTLIAQEIAKYAIGDGHVATLNVPVGGIVIWSGTVASIPSGWALCDGSTVTTSDGERVTTPDLRNRFVVGAGGDYSVGAKGGALSASATTNSTGSHNHSGETGATSVVVPHTGWGTQGGGPGSIQSGALLVGSGATELHEALESIRRAGTDKTTTAHTHDISSDGAHSHTVSVNTVPPYYAMAYIMRVEIIQEVVPEANHAANATLSDAALKLKTPRLIRLTGEVTGSVSFDGSANVDIATSLLRSNISSLITSEFPAYLNAIGWQKLPSGLIMQWGKTLDSAGDTNHTLNFPLAFPNGVLQAYASVSASSLSNDDVFAKVLSYTKTTITVRLEIASSDAAVSGNRYASYLAIGY